MADEPAGEMAIPARVGIPIVMALVDDHEAAGAWQRAPARPLVRRDLGGHAEACGSLAPLRDQCGRDDARGAAHQGARGGESRVGLAGSDRLGEQCPTEAPQRREQARMRSALTRKEPRRMRIARLRRKRRTRERGGNFARSAAATRQESGGASREMKRFSDDGRHRLAPRPRGRGARHARGRAGRRRTHRAPPVRDLQWRREIRAARAQHPPAGLGVRRRRRR